METRTSLDAVDSRIVLLGYAIIVAASGFLLLVAPAWIAHLLRASLDGTDGLTVLAGTSLVAWAIVAIALSTIPNVIDRRRALGWFVAAHLSPAVILLVEHTLVWPAAWANGIISSWGFATAMLFYAWSNALGGPRQQRSDTEQLRRQYEQGIRLAAAQEERHRLARDLHDSIKQQIFAIQTAAATAETRLAGEAGGAREALDMVRTSAREAMTEMETMTEQLKATPLENDSLVAALRRQCDALRFRTGAEVDLTVGTLPRNEQVTPGTQQAIFRVTQEALSNIARHARATRVRVSLDARAGSLALVVHDNGTGYESSSASTGSGVSNMRARADELAGTFTIAPAPDGGTIVRFAVPFSDASPQRYYRKLRGAAIGLAIVAVTVVLVRPRDAWMWWLVIIPTFELIRYLVAWLRSRRMTASAA
jgi:signal transduction histidine kinase